MMSQLLNSASTATKRKSFSLFKNLKVEFSGEEALDVGGPRREVQMQMGVTGRHYGLTTVTTTCGYMPGKVCDSYG